MQAFRKAHLEAKHSFRAGNMGTKPYFDSEFRMAPDTVTQKQLFSVVPVYHKDLQPLSIFERGQERPEQEYMFSIVSVTKDKKTQTCRKHPRGAYRCPADLQSHSPQTQRALVAYSTYFWNSYTIASCFQTWLGIPVSSSTLTILCWCSARGTAAS